MNYTPGPWIFSGLTIKGPHPKDPKNRSRVVAKAVWEKGTYIDEAQNNARLIAAAPEMLEALERVFEIELCLSAKTERIAKDAIAKAKGEAQ